MIRKSYSSIHFKILYGCPSALDEALCQPNQIADQVTVHPTSFRMLDAKAHDCLSPDQVFCPFGTLF